MRRRQWFPIVIVVLVGSAAAQPVAVPEFQAMQQVINDPLLGRDEKVARLKAFLDWNAISTLYQIERVDTDAAVRLARQRFDQPGRTRAERLALGKWLRERDDSAAFAQQYAALVVSLVLDGGRDELWAARENSLNAAVGHLAFAAAGFQGSRREWFATMADPRTIPVLIECLQVPDEVYAEDQGDVIRGKPGEPTGRNAARQQIPVALARLGAVAAVEPLIRLAKEHHDINFRANCAYAIGVLATDQRCREVEARLGARPAPSQAPILLFAVGHGLADRGEERGLAYLGFDQGVQWGDGTAGVIYAAEQRLEAVAQLKTAGAVRFLDGLLAHDALRRLLQYEVAAVKLEAWEKRSPAEFLADQRPRLVTLWRGMLDHVKSAGLHELPPHMADVARASRDDEIRRLAKEAGF